MCDGFQNGGSSPRSILAPTLIIPIARAGVAYNARAAKELEHLLDWQEFEQARFNMLTTIVEGVANALKGMAT